MSKFQIKYIESTDYNDEKYIGAVLDEKMIGFLRFKVIDRKPWLYFVGVNKDYRHLKEEQVGSNLLKIFENYCAARNLWGLEGKYWPEGEKESVVRKFYERNGFKIEREDYDIIVYKSQPVKNNLSVEVENVDFEKFYRLLQEYLEKDKNEDEHEQEKE